MKIGFVDVELTLISVHKHPTVHMPFLQRFETV